MSTSVDGPVAAASTAAEDPEPVHARSDVGRRIALTVVIVVGVLALTAGWLAYRGVQAASALQDAAAAVPDARRAVDDRDVRAVRAAVYTAQEATGRATAATGDPVWRLAQHLPWVGAQLSAVSTVSTALDDVTHDALPAALDATDLLAGERGLRDEDGRVRVEELAALAPRLSAAADVARRAREQVAGIDTDLLAAPLVDPLHKAVDGLGKLSRTLDVGAEATTLLPPMLGADGPRTYLVAALNSAELRATGGIVGSIVSLHVDDGRLTITDQRSTADLPGLEASVLPLTDAELAVHGDRLGRFVQNASMTPDFPRGAQLLAARWTATTGQPVDGVLATDPVAVAALLKAVGSVEVPPVDGDAPTRLDAASAVDTLLRESYVRYPDAATNDAFFRAVTSTVFGALTTGAGDPARLVEEVSDVGREGRVRVWSAVPAEEARLAALPVGGAFLSGPFGDATGVFLDDATTGKLDAYLTSTVTVEDLVCTGATPHATVRVDLAYDPPADVTSYPQYVLGFEAPTVPAGWLATTLSVYAPVGADLGALRFDDGFVSGATPQVAGRDVQLVASLLQPGERHTYRFDVPVRDGRVDVWTTPTASSGGSVRATCPSGD